LSQAPPPMPRPPLSRTLSITPAPTPHPPLSRTLFITPAPTPHPPLSRTLFITPATPPLRSCHKPRPSGLNTATREHSEANRAVSDGQPCLFCRQNTGFDADLPSRPTPWLSHSRAPMPMAVTTTGFITSRQRAGAYPAARHTGLFRTPSHTAATPGHARASHAGILGHFRSAPTCRLTGKVLPGHAQAGHGKRATRRAPLSRHS
jgi:hypothetical protein